MVTMVFMVDPTDWGTEYKLFLAIVGIPMVVSAVLGITASQVVYRRRRRAFQARMEKYSNMKFNSRH